MKDQIFELIENTNRNIFLTGKAGTGKTTFLNYFVKNTRKNHIVVAPTGIAAINAGGVTIHSMFALPLRPFVPVNEPIDTASANNISHLISHFRYGKHKLKLLRELEIIIIDEVSMLRADVLDMVDFALRKARRNQERFGGVQMLFIGDLFQLPPVIREDSEYILQKYYKSPFFFDAKVLENVDLLTVELTEVFRQKDPEFLDLLNSIRDGDTQKVDFQKLNERYIPDFEPKEGEHIVHLCSHNRMADNINQKKINELKTSLFSYKANIFGDFKENIFPNDENLELKVGAQVMFIRNDSSGEKRYYNGRLAEISRLNEDKVYVILEGRTDEMEVEREVWENKKYTLNDDKEIVEEVIGSFEQFPLRLAWAVTIHKSQGLTFDKVIIDAGKSFTLGQVYVALSRCRTLEGIYLKSKITPSVIFSDKRIDNFQEDTNANDKIEDILEQEKYDYSIKKVLKTVDCQWIIEILENWYKEAKKDENLDVLQVQELYFSLQPNLKNLNDVFVKFSKVLSQKKYLFTQGKETWEEIESKAKGGVNFFFDKVRNQIFEPLKQFLSVTKENKNLKNHNENLKNWLDDLEDYLNGLKRSALLNQKLFSSDNEIVVESKIAKIPTHILTFKLFQEGKTVQEIAKERGLVAGTIYGHLAKIAEQKNLDLSKIINSEKINIFEKIFSENPQENLNAWKQVLPQNFEYHEIRILWNSYKNKENP